MGSFYYLSRTKATHLYQVWFPVFVSDKFTSGLNVGITNVLFRQTVYGIDIIYLSVNKAKVYLTSFICVYSEVRQTFQWRREVIHWHASNAGDKERGRSIFSVTCYGEHITVKGSAAEARNSAGLWELWSRHWDLCLIPLGVISVS
jgi:hypothetical protein